MTRARQLARGALLLAVATGAAGAVAAASEASASSCSAITISAGQSFSFDVSSVTVTEGGCVRFANLTDVTVTVTVSGSGFSERLPARTPASASRSYTANKSAGVTATDGVRSGHGSITVESAGSTTAATPTPTQTPSTVVAPPGKTPTPTPTPSSSKTTNSTDEPLPDNVATEGAASVNTQHQFALPAIPSLPPQQSSGDSTGGGPPTASHPVVAPQQVKSSDPAYTSTTVDPIHGPRRGLPATVAAVLLFGLATAYARTALVAGTAVERRPAPRPVRRTV
ncbi:MAG TPA: hypothetical protein VHD81_01870 [Mycobacteriales bacterium]|nr:hypothetical protein [Mycobacteriales bacterium]